MRNWTKIEFFSAMEAPQMVLSSWPLCNISSRNDIYTVLHRALNGSSYLSFQTGVKKELMLFQKIVLHFHFFLTLACVQRFLLLLHRMRQDLRKRNLLYFLRDDIKAQSRMSQLQTTCSSAVDKKTPQEEAKCFSLCFLYKQVILLLAFNPFRLRKFSFGYNGSVIICN